MLNLIQSDLYKLKKSKYFIVCLLLNLVLASGTILLMDFSDKITGQRSKSAQQLNQDNTAVTGPVLTTDHFPRSYEELSASSQMLSFFSGETTILLAIVISLFAGGEFTYGTIRNLASRGYSRYKIYASKFIVSMLVSILFAVVHALPAAMKAACLYGFGTTSPGFAVHMISGTVLALILNTALAAIFLMFSMLIRQNGGSLAINICFSELLSLLAMAGMARGILPEKGTSALFLRVIVACSFGLILSTAIGTVSFARRDIR